MEVLSHNTPHDQTNNTHISMEVLSHSTHMIKQTIQTFPWRYYLIMLPMDPNKQYKQFPWKYYLTIPL